MEKATKTFTVKEKTEVFDSHGIFVMTMFPGDTITGVHSGWWVRGETRTGETVSVRRGACK